MSNLIELVPSASSLIESIRSIGHSFETAIADIIDNSISAQATKIEIKFFLEDNNPIIQIIDNGFGMSFEDLKIAMTLGSKNPLDKRSDDDLGRFGLGLKAASFSQCCKLTVVSKRGKALNALRLDIDEIKRMNRFVAHNLTKEEVHSLRHVDTLMELESGTIVQWECFDRIEHSTVELNEELMQLLDNALEHTSLVFHRFIDEGMEICVNNQTLRRKDPFLVSHKGTQERPTKTLNVDGESIEVTAFVLPHYSRLQQKDIELAGKVTDLFNNQGFYIYRNKRLLIWGSYLGASRMNELSKNLRVRVDIPNTLDHLWEIDVKKSRATIPSRIKRNLLNVVSDGIDTSKRVNTHKGKHVNKTIERVWSIVEDRDNKFKCLVNKDHVAYRNLISICSDEQIKMIDIYLKMIESNVPTQAIYGLIADGNDLLEDCDNISVDELKKSLELLKPILGDGYLSYVKSLIWVEPYVRSESAIEFLSQEIKEENINER